MDYYQELIESICQKLVEAKKMNDQEAIERYLDRLEKAMEAKEQMEGSLKVLEEIKSDLKNEHKAKTLESVNRSEEENRKARGERIVREFLEEMIKKGIRLERIRGRGRKFKNEKGNIIGIATATEREPNKWFLGIKNGDYDFLILICDGNDGIRNAIILPRNILKRYWHFFSIEKKYNQVKFHVSKNGNRFYLDIGDKHIDVSDNVNNFLYLR